MSSTDRLAPSGAAYAQLAAQYAATVDTRPWNALYERPATISLLPPLRGLRVLDAGCGNGWYAEQYVSAGATVTSFDREPHFVDVTRQRLGERAAVLQADLAAPLRFAAAASFDLVVSPMVLHYIEHWEPVFSEFRRVLRPNGLVVFSTHHPTMDWKLFEIDDYFATVLVEDQWQEGTMTFYRRPLTAISAALAATGFVIERLLEPHPLPALRDVNPAGYEKLMHNPWFLMIRARRDG